jgi:hypothetical protein
LDTYTCLHQYCNVRMFTGDLSNVEFRALEAAAYRDSITVT